MEKSIINFAKKYDPDNQAMVALKNGRVLDVVNGRYYDERASIMLQDGGIVGMLGIKVESNTKA